MPASIRQEGPYAVHSWLALQTAGRDHPEVLDEIWRTPFARRLSAAAAQEPTSIGEYVSEIHHRYLDPRRAPSPPRFRPDTESEFSNSEDDDYDDSRATSGPQITERPVASGRPRLRDPTLEHITPLSAVGIQAAWSRLNDALGATYIPSRYRDMDVERPPELYFETQSFQRIRSIEDLLRWLQADGRSLNEVYKQTSDNTTNNHHLADCFRHMVDLLYHTTHSAVDQNRKAEERLTALETRVQELSAMIDHGSAPRGSTQHGRVAFGSTSRSTRSRKRATPSDFATDQLEHRSKAARREAQNCAGDDAGSSPRDKLISVRGAGEELS